MKDGLDSDQEGSLEWETQGPDQEKQNCGGDRFVQNMEMSQETGRGVVSCCRGDLETEGNLWGKREKREKEGERGRERILILMNILGHDWRHR